MTLKVLKQAPLLRAMHRMNLQQRDALLKTADKKLIESVCECAYNTLKGRVPLKNAQRTKLRAHKQVLSKLIKRGECWKKKRRLLVHKGGISRDVNGEVNIHDTSLRGSNIVDLVNDLHCVTPVWAVRIATNRTNGFRDEKGSVPTFAWRESRKPYKKKPLSTPDRYLSLNFSVLSSPVYCESYALDHATTEQLSLTTPHTLWCPCCPSGCSVSVNTDIAAPQPLLLIPGGSLDVYGFKLPTVPGDVINFLAGEALTLACPGTNNFLNVAGTGNPVVTATCVSGKNFRINGVNYSFSTLTCRSIPSHSARATGKICYNKNIEIEVGFLVGTNFYNLHDICFDSANANPIYTKFDMVANIGGLQVGFPRPSWVEGGFYPNLTPNTQYNRNQQIATFSRILGSTDLGAQYVSSTSDYYLSRGHLIAKADYVYGSQQRATFYYMNSAPQWQTFNGGNWNTLEDNVRRYARDQSVDLVIYTGTYGITTLPDARGVEKELYLYVDENNNNAMPIPKLYWKVVYNPLSQAATVFIGVNNPYITSLKNDYQLCNDVSSKVSWLTWDKNSQKKGFSYACEFADFRKSVPAMPAITVKSLLV
uniref:DNA/RNA non-specific endonuclease domain-containing protein n=1 Tax=Timema tahoe TaxID=61484 RepID=A0A7R9IHG5_9NEOP|nr:unnamed protein product [Timema tahoe]